MNLNLPRVALWFAFSAVLLISAGVSAQLPQTRLTSVFPPGGQQGTSLELTVGGSDLDEVDQLIFSAPGITAAQKRDAADHPVAGVFVVSIAPETAPGLYDVRARGLFGISNPRAFRIDTLPETAEREPNNSPEQANLVLLNTVVNARANSATDVDYFRFRVNSGQTVVIRSQAAALDSTMQPVLQLLDAEGRRLAESRRVFGQEADLVYTATSAQDLLLKVADIVYAGGADYVYRLTIDTRPLVDFVLPPIVSTSLPAQITLFGRHLPGGQPVDRTLAGSPLQQLQIEVPAAAAAETQTGFASYSASLSAFMWPGVDGNLITLTTADHPVTLAVEDPADQKISLPAEVVGQFAAIGDEDIYRFEGKKGESWVVDVFAHRLGSNADPLLMIEQVVVAADGTETFKRLATEDDDRQNPGGNDLPTLSTDPSFLLVVPEDGQYRIRLTDRYADSRGDPRMVYRMSVRPPVPDFRLIVFDAYQSADGKAPSTSGAINLRKGGSYQLSVYAWRHDGHNDPIRIDVNDLPDGVVYSPAVIGPGQSAATLILSADDAASELAAAVSIIGRSGTAESEVSRRARVATLIHDAVNGLPRTARISESLVVGVMKDPQPFSIVIDPATVALSQDQQLLIPVTLHRRGGFDGKVDITFLGVPANVDAPAFAIEQGSDRGVARLFIKENAPVSTSTIILSGTAAIPYRRNPWLAERADARVHEATALVTLRQQITEANRATLATTTQLVAVATERVAALQEETAALTTQQLSIREQFSAAVAEYQSMVEELQSARQQLAAVETSSDAETEVFQSALQSIADGAAAVQVASGKIDALSSHARQLTESLKELKQLERIRLSEKKAADSGLPALSQAATDAEAAVKAAEALVEQATSQKTAAEETAKKAAEATKSASVNLRSVSAAIVLDIHPAPGKVTAQIPDGGAVKKGGQLEVKVTIARKNNFSGAFQLELVVPEGVTGIQSAPAEVPADQTESVLTINATPDAAAGDIAHAVIRATGDFNGRRASVDVPAAINIVE